MYIYIYIYIYIYMYIYIYIYTHVYTALQVWEGLNLWIFMYVHVCICKHIYTMRLHIHSIVVGLSGLFFVSIPCISHIWMYHITHMQIHRAHVTHMIYHITYMQIHTNEMSSCLFVNIHSTAVGLGGLVFVPIFKAVTGLPPFAGISV